MVLSVSSEFLLSQQRTSTSTTPVSDIAGNSFTIHQQRSVLIHKRDYRPPVLLPPSGRSNSPRNPSTMTTSLQVTSSSCLLHSSLTGPLGSPLTFFVWCSPPWMFASLFLFSFLRDIIWGQDREWGLSPMFYFVLFLKKFSYVLLYWCRWGSLPHMGQILT